MYIIRTEKQEPRSKKATQNKKPKTQNKKPKNQKPKKGLLKIVIYFAGASIYISLTV
jgi:hypothetical protein